MNKIRMTKRKHFEPCHTCDVKSSCVPCQAYAEVENGDRLACNSGSRRNATMTALIAQKVMEPQTA